MLQYKLADGEVM